MKSQGRLLARFSYTVAASNMAGIHSILAPVSQPRSQGPLSSSLEKVPWFRLVTCLPKANSSPPGWPRFSSRSERKSECKSSQTGTKTEEWKSLAYFFSKTGTLKKSTVYYLRRFRSTNNADFPSTKYFTVGSICFEFAEGV